MLTLEKLYPDNYYHIFNRANGNNALFLSDDNYHFFLKKYDFYLSNRLDTLAFCLLPNHFHFLVRVKSGLPEYGAIHQLWSNLFNSYTKSFNRLHNRYGNLFQRPFKRKRIDTERYFHACVSYIHLNPQLHGIVADYRTYPWSSYARYLHPAPSKLPKTEMLEKFGGKQQFTEFHTKCYSRNLFNAEFALEWLPKK